MINVTLLGNGGTIPLPKRYLTSLFVDVDGHGILIDAGECTQVTLKINNISMTSISTILITHKHNDHILGLPGVLLAMSDAGRLKPVTIIAPNDTIDRLKNLISTCDKLNFKIKYKSIIINVLEEKIKISQHIDINAFKLIHTYDTECYGYTINIINDKKEQKNIKLCYATDTRPCNTLLKNAQGSNLLVLEAMYLSESIERAEMKKHMLASEALNIAKKAQAKTVWLTHFSPLVTNAEIIKFAEKNKNYEELEISNKALTKTIFN